MVTTLTYSINEAISELVNLPKRFPKIYNKNKNVLITVYSIWRKHEVRLKNLSLVEILAEDLIDFRAAWKADKDNEGLKDQIIRIETILFDLGILPASKTMFGIIFGRKEYPIHIIVKHHTLIFS